jgi:phosphatidylserine decarboxylase
VTAPLVSSRRRKKATGHIKLRIGFVSAADSTAESKGAPTVDFRTAYDYLLKRSEERNILTVPAFKGIGTTKGRSGENGDDSDDSASSASELQDDGLSSDSSSDEDEGDDSPASAPTSAPPSPRNKLRELPSSSSVPRTSANGLLLPSLGSAALGVPAVTSASSTTTLNEPSSSSGSLPTPRRGSTPALAKPTRKGSGDSYFDLSEGASSSEPGRRRRKFRRSKKSTKEFSYSTDSEILGVVLLEIKGAEDLPRLKNAFKIGYVFGRLAGVRGHAKAAADGSIVLLWASASTWTHLSSSASARRSSGRASSGTSSTPSGTRSSSSTARSTRGAALLAGRSLLATAMS